MKHQTLNLAARREALLSIKPKRKLERANKWLCGLFMVSIFATPVLGAFVACAMCSVETIEEFNSVLSARDLHVILQVAAGALPLALMALIMNVASRLRCANILKDFKDCYASGRVASATPKRKIQNKLVKALDSIFSLVFYPLELIMKVLVRPAEREARELGFESSFEMGFPATIEENGKKRKVFVITDKASKEWEAGRVVEVYTLPDSDTAISGEFRDRLMNA